MAWGGSTDSSYTNQVKATKNEPNDGQAKIDRILSSNLPYAEVLERIIQIESSGNSSNGDFENSSELDREALLNSGLKSRAELYEFKRQQLESFQSDSWSWDLLNQFLKDQAKKSKLSELELTMKKFLDTSKELQGKEVDTKQIQAGVVYLIKVLRGTKYISNEQRHQLKLYFGEYNETPMNRAVNLVEALEKLSKIELIQWNLLDSPPKSEDLMDKPFGSGITLMPFTGNLPHVRCFLDEEGCSQSNGTISNGDVVHSFDWLIDQLKPKYSVKEQTIGLGVHEMASAVMELLKNKLKSNEDLQSDLLELLGFDL